MEKIVKMRGKFIGLLLCLSLQAFAQQDLIVDSYKGQDEIIGLRSVTLNPGFAVPQGKSVRVFTRQSFRNCVPLTGVPSAAQNYISTRVFKVAGVNSSTVELPRTLCEVNQSIQYMDGLGRPIQTVSVQGSSTFHDLVQPVVYDSLERQAFSYLPYAALSGGQGSFRAAALSEQKSFYAAPPVGVSAVSGAFSQSLYEASPLNRLKEQGAPGRDWQLAAGHTLKTEYGANNSDVNYSATGFAVRLYKAVPLTAAGHEQERTLLSSSFYGANELSLVISKDENWQAADGKAGTVEEYKDKEGNVVLKRLFNQTASGIEVLSTYYVYDDFGNLCFVLPPGALADGGTVSQGTLDSFCYQYRYDGQRRLTGKRVPGTSDWSSMVYNALDQLVLSQDANQKGLGQWSYSKYDALGRVTSTGLYNSASSRADLQVLVNGQANLWEYWTGSAWSNQAFPQTITVCHSILYYDDYSFAHPSGYALSTASNNTRGLQTGALLNVLGTTDMLLSMSYYDQDGRVVKTFKQHYLSGKVDAGNYDETDNTYSFVGELLSSFRQHHAGAALTSVANRYEYDHMGRKIASWSSINGAAELVLNKQDYNEMGQLLTKSVHSSDGAAGYLQSTAYSYNERGWLKGTSSALFNLSLKYQEGTVPQYNGNISDQYWGAQGSLANHFTYGYDKLNRLLSGVSTGVVMSEALSYDVMGNISALSRDGGVAGLYSYQGNQLQKVTGGLLATGVYAYDANGNVITDGRTGVNLTYNTLNLPSKVTKTGLDLSYVYDASGDKLKKISNGVTRDYIDGIEYNGAGIELIHTEEGLARRNGTDYSYEYNLNDHLGNVRMSFYRNPGSGLTETIQKDDYYPFGLRKIATAGQNKYLYNGKELQEELGQYDYGARFYDPVIGRWTTIDPSAENDASYSPYIYGFNNAVRFTDPDGKWPDDDGPGVLSVTGNFVKGLGQSAWSTVTGVYGIARHPINTATAIGSAVVHPINTAKAIGNAVSQGYDDFQNGNADIKANIAGNVIGDVAQLFVGAGEAKTAINGIRGTKVAEEVAQGVKIANEADNVNKAVNTLEVGSYAGESIPARSKGRSFTAAERSKMNEIGEKTGCHTCGVKTSGTKSGNFIPDHQPASGLIPDGASQNLYPHCQGCSARQGGQVSAAKRAAKKVKEY